MEQLQPITAAEVEDRFKLNYQIMGGLNNNCVKIDWRSVDSTCKPRWFALKTFTGVMTKYVSPKKWPPIVFALADEDAFAYCDKILASNAPSAASAVWKSTLMWTTSDW